MGTSVGALIAGLMTAMSALFGRGGAITAVEVRVLVELVVAVLIGGVVIGGLALGRAGYVGCLLALAATVVLGLATGAGRFPPILILVGAIGDSAIVWILLDVGAKLGRRVVRRTITERWAWFGGVAGILIWAIGFATRG